MSGWIAFRTQVGHLPRSELCRFCCKSRCKSRCWLPRGVIRSLRCDSLRRRAMMGRLNHDQGQLFYSFSLDEVVPDDHLVRKIAAVLDLSWVRAELAPHYPNNGRPSIDPELMIRMLIIGYVFAIRSERALCRDVLSEPGLSLVLWAFNRRQD